MTVQLFNDSGSSTWRNYQSMPSIANGYGEPHATCSQTAESDTSATSALFVDSFRFQDISGSTRLHANCALAIIGVIERRLGISPDERVKRVLSDQPLLASIVRDFAVRVRSHFPSHEIVARLDRARDRAVVRVQLIVRVSDLDRDLECLGRLDRDWLVFQSAAVKERVIVLLG